MPVVFLSYSLNLLCLEKCLAHCRFSMNEQSYETGISLGQILPKEDSEAVRACYSHSVKGGARICKQPGSLLFTTAACYCMVPLIYVVNFKNTFFYISLTRQLPRSRGILSSSLCPDWQFLTHVTRSIIVYGMNESMNEHISYPKIFT